MRACPYHYDGEICEHCKDFYSEGKKEVEVAKVAEEMKSGVRASPRESFSIKSLIFPAILTAVLVGLVTFICWMTVPGFLKPDVEVPFVDVKKGFRDDKEEFAVWFGWDNATKGLHLPINKVDVALRSDGKEYTNCIAER